MRLQSGLEGEMRIARQSDGVAIALDDLVHGNQDGRGAQFIDRDVGPAQCIERRNAFRGKGVDNMRDFRRGIDALLPTDLDHVLDDFNAVGNGARSRAPGRRRLPSLELHVRESRRIGEEFRTDPPGNQWDGSASRAATRTRWSAEFDGSEGASG